MYEAGELGESGHHAVMAILWRRLRSEAQALHANSGSPAALRRSSAEILVRKDLRPC